MTDREKWLGIVDAIYLARAEGNKEEVAKFWAEGATYRLAGDRILLQKFPVGPHDARLSVETIIDLFTFENYERVDAIVEDGKVAVQWRVTLKAPDGERASTELYDLWKINAQGKITSLLQFGDTALIADMLERVS